jgi:pyrroline-5-carboxylate reductase
MKSKNIGFVGAGNMAGALIKGLLHSGTVDPAQIQASDVREERLAELASAHGIATTKDNAELAAWADIVVLAVKPQVIDKVMVPIAKAVRPHALVVSIAAGVPIESLESRLPSGTRVVRTMPNTAAIALAGATAIAPGTHASNEDLELARQLFEATGRVVMLDESLLDAVTGLSGSGPAYIMLIIEALADGGVKVGLHRETALLLAAQTVYGSAKLLLETGEHPGRIKDTVTSPGGTAIAGLHTLEAGGLRTTLINAVESATRRSIELGEKMAEKLRSTASSPPRGTR